MTGHLRLSRDILEWGWYKDPNTRSVFIHLLIKANWKDGEYMGYKIGRGSLVTGRKQLALELDLSERNIRTAINHLKSTNELTIKTTNKFSIITICNYERWTEKEKETDQQTDQQSDQQVTSNRPASDQQVTTIEEINKEKNKERNNIIIPPLPPQGEEKEELLAKIAELEERHASIVKEMTSRQEELERENAELKDKIEKDKKANRDLDLSIVSEEMMPVVEEWLAYKRQKRQSYKPKGFIIFYNKLMKDCGGSVAVAKQMVDFSIANNYDGLFKPKESYRRYELPGQVMRGEKREYNEDNFFER